MEVISKVLVVAAIIFFILWEWTAFILWVIKKTGNKFTTFVMEYSFLGFIVCGVLAVLSFLL